MKTKKGTGKNNTVDITNYFVYIKYCKLEIGGSIVRQIVLYPGEDGFWIAECPSLPGCISQGETKETTIANIKEAITAYIDALEEDNLPVPGERFETLLMAV